MSDSVQPHRQQPTRPHRAWDSPGKNTGVGCHFLLHCMKVKSESEVAKSCLTLSDPMDCSLPGSSIHGIFQARVLEWVAIAFSEMMVEEYYFLSASKVPAIPQAFKLDLLQCACNTRSIELCLNPTRLKRTELWLLSLYQKIKDNDNCPSDSQCYCICKK